MGGRQTALLQDEMRPSGILPSAHIILALLADWVEDYWELIRLLA
jgi:hypothetical protein